MPSSFDQSKDIPSLANKVIFITGATAGLGKGSVLALAKHKPAHIFLSGRNQNAADAVIAEVSKIAPTVKTTFIKCDISSLASVKEAAATFERANPQRLDVLMLNAGIMATEAKTSADGYEMQFATNYLGHTLLVKLLLPILQQTAKLPDGDPRVINMTSIAYKEAPSNGIDFATLKTNQSNLGGLMGMMGRWRRYGQSKLAQMLYSQQLAEEHPEITSVSIHPGVILTDLFGNIPFSVKLPVLLMSLGAKTPVEEGHYNQCWAATCEKDKLRNGEYYEPVGKVGDRTTKLSKDNALAKKLWDWTEKEIQPFA